jgi:hypothetical protein
VASQYPWDDWTDGRVWLLRDNADFTCMPKSIRSQVAKIASKRGLQLASRLLDGGVLVQAYPAGSTWKPNLAAINQRRIRKAMDNPR